MAKLSHIWVPAHYFQHNLRKLVDRLEQTGFSMGWAYPGKIWGITAFEMNSNAFWAIRN